VEATASIDEILKIVSEFDASMNELIEKTNPNLYFKIRI